MPDPRVIELRRHLRHKFPAAHRFETSANRMACQPAADSADNFHPRSLPRGAITEIVSAIPATGLSLVLAALLDDPPPPPVPTSMSNVQRSMSNVRCSMFDVHPPLVLIDARDSFDPDSFPAAQCARLLWVRCRTTDHALAAADLLVRDGNLPVILLDLAALPARELHRIHRAAWHRLRQLAAAHGPSLLVLSPAPTVPCATLRLTLTTRLTLDHLDLSRAEALRQLHPETTRLRHAQ